MGDELPDHWVSTHLARAAHALNNPAVDRLLEDVRRLSLVTHGEEIDLVDVDVDEHRVTSETGGQKGAKNTEFLRLPDSIAEVARHFFDGSRKYEDPAPGVANWQLGYAWSLSLNALYRHLDAWRQGDSVDPEFGRTHLAAVAFHALVLMDFEAKGIGTDDRYTAAARDRFLATRNA